MKHSCEIVTSRSVHLIDVENLVGNPRRHGHTETKDVPQSVFDHTILAYMHRFVNDDDDVWIAADIGRFTALTRHFPAIHILAGYGPDGADKALLERFNAKTAVRTCRTLHIASGDGIFATVAHDFRQRGGRVLIHARWKQVAWELYRYSHGVDYIDVDSKEAA